MLSIHNLYLILENKVPWYIVLQQPFEFVPYYFSIIFIQKMLITSISSALPYFPTLGACEAQGKKENSTAGFILAFPFLLASN